MKRRDYHFNQNCSGASLHRFTLDGDGFYHSSGPHHEFKISRYADDGFKIRRLKRFHKLLVASLINEFVADKENENDQ